MKVLPASLGGRLLAAAALFVALAIVVAGLVIAGILGQFVRFQIDSRLDAQILAVAGSLRSGSAGPLAADPAIDGPPFDRPKRGWYWQADAGGAVVASRSLENERLPFPSEPPSLSPFEFLRPWPAEIRGPRGEQLIARAANRIVDGRPVMVLATAPRDAFVRPLLDVLVPVLIAMLVLGLGLFAALVAQVRLGLRPLRRLQRDLGAIQAGQTDRLPIEDQPGEIRPLVAEINALLERNEAGLERARRHVANLAHGLKTPLARLALALNEEERDPDGALAPLVRSMDRLIRHHLARARTAALATAHRSRTDLAPRLDDLVVAMERIHAERRIRCERAGIGELWVACEAQDCDELFGNLLDNAFRHARRLVRLRSEDAGDAVRIAVEDDGPGMTDEAAEEALRPGRRLDETTTGYGFGLPIAREIAELHGGDLQLETSEFGGLRVAVTLPKIPTAAN